jgi:hypothetical protein
MHRILKKRIEIPEVSKLCSKMPWVAELYTLLIHPSRWATLARRPWSMSKVFYVSVVVGVMAPPLIGEGRESRMQLIIAQHGRGRGVKP